MTLRLVVRTLLARPTRTLVLAGGFGFGVAVMAMLLGVGEVILEQARSPALRGGGDAVVVGTTGAVTSARFVIGSVLGAAPLAGQVALASPTRRASLRLTHAGRTVRVVARGGVPSLERALGNPELDGQPQWTDTAADAGWARPSPEVVLRAMDRFHPVPDAPAWADSWAEWLYFNGQSDDGATKFYLTFLVGPRTRPGKRSAGVRLQLDREGVITTFAQGAEVGEAEVLREAPDLAIGSSRVVLEGLRYTIDLDLPGDGGRGHVRGRLEVAADAGRSVPPLAIRGAAGWISGYTVPVLSGRTKGTLDVSGTRVALDGFGYHDHNWGFWRDVTWQWGQVAHDGLSFLYGRVFPPLAAADPARVPGFLVVMGPDGPLGTASEVTFTHEDDASGRPRVIRVAARGPGVDLLLRLDVEQAVGTRMGGPMAQSRPLTFLQMRARYHVTGTAAGRTLDFRATGAAETFRGD